MSFRPGSRIFNTFRSTFSQPLLRRRAGTSAAPEQSGLTKLWNSPIGPKTVHFWYVANSPLRADYGYLLHATFFTTHLLNTF
jgi:hypothetical protein